MSASPSRPGSPATETAPLAPDEPRRGSPRPRALLRLLLMHGQLDGQTRWRLDDSGMVLGRHTLANNGHADPHLSRQHAAIAREAEGWMLRDLGSRNRSRINGAEVDRPVQLCPGDVIRLGSTLLLWCGERDELPPLPPDPELVGDSPAMRALRESIDAVAEHPVSVLITGETGAGKEMVARALHRRSGRGGAFVALNCGGLAEGVLESELFGHVRGAFTGAVAAREGLLRAADRGTLLLDELGEMPLDVQVKLLRVLETRRVRPVGSTQETPIDVRIVAATNRDLVAAVRAERFRADLYARLGQWLIPVPPLRERREDLPALIAHLLGRLGAASRPLAVELVEALCHHAWPLNVRGLLNVLSIAVISSPVGAPLGLTRQVVEALAAERALARPTPIAVPSPPETPAEEAPLPEASTIEAALARHHGKMADAARALGCSRSKLYRWCAMYGIDFHRFRLRPGRPAKTDN